MPYLESNYRFCINTFLREIENRMFILLSNSKPEEQNS